MNPYIEQLIENFILDVKFKLHVVSTKSTVLYYTVLYIGHLTLTQQALTVNLLQVGKMMLTFAVNGRYLRREFVEIPIDSLEDAVCGFIV